MARSVFRMVDLDLAYADLTPLNISRHFLVTGTRRRISGTRPRVSRPRASTWKLKEKNLPPTPTVGHHGGRCCRFRHPPEIFASRSSRSESRDSNRNGPIVVIARPWCNVVRVVPVPAGLFQFLRRRAPKLSKQIIWRSPRLRRRHNRLFRHPSCLCRSAGELGSDKQFK